MTILICFRSSDFYDLKYYYLFYVREHLRDLFPEQLPYNRFIELELRVAVVIMLLLQVCCLGRCTGISPIDSTFIPACHNKHISRNKVFKEYASVGKSTMGQYFNLKLHLTCNERGELVNFTFTEANVDGRDGRVFNGLSGSLFGKLFAGKGYISQRLFERLYNNGISLVTGLRSNMKDELIPLYDKISLRKRSAIETINGELKDVARLVRFKYRNVLNFAIDALSALAAYCFFEKKPAISVDFCIDRQGQQLTLS